MEDAIKTYSVNITTVINRYILLLNGESWVIAWLVEVQKKEKTTCSADGFELLWKNNCLNKVSKDWITWVQIFSNSGA